MSAKQFELSKRVTIETRDPHGPLEAPLLVIMIDGVEIVWYFISSETRTVLEEAFDTHYALLAERSLCAETAAAHAALALHHAKWLGDSVGRVRDALVQLRGAVKP